MSNHGLAVPDWMTKDYLLQVLNKSFPEDSIVLNDYQITPGSNVGDNYACQILRTKFDLTRNGRQENFSMISKIMPITETSQQISENFQVFDTEELMLSETIPLLEKKFNGRAPRYFPKQYWNDPKHQALYMEDLKESGYQLRDKSKGLDLDHSMLVARSLAVAHASSYLLLQEQPQIKDKYLNIFWKYQKGSVSDRFVSGGVKYMVEGLHCWPISEERKNKIRNNESTLFKKGCDAYARKEDKFNVILHGDCWNNNMMFKYDENGVQDVKLVDFQLCNYNSLGLDINSFLFTSTQVDVILNHLDELLETYYTTFIGITGEIEGFSLEKVRKEFEDRLPFGCICAFVMRAGLYSDFDLDASLQGKHSEKNQQSYRNKSYVDQAARLLPLFEKHGVFD